MMGGAAAAVGASACCAGPLLLVSLGVGGAWSTRLAALSDFQPLFIAVALLCFGIAYRQLHRQAQACAPGQACASPAVRRRQRIVFWLLAAAAAALMTFPFYAPLFY